MRKVINWVLEEFLTICLTLIILGAISSILG